MKTCHLNIALNKKQIIDTMYNSNGYYLRTSKNVYDYYNINDEVIFNCKFNHSNLKGIIRNKYITPSSVFKNIEDERTYIFIIDLMVKIEVICL